MTDADLIKELILLFGFTFGMIITGYEEHAVARGWPIGDWFRGVGFVKILGFITWIGAAIASLTITPWWFIFITVIGGFFVGFILSNIFKSAIQMIALVGIVVCFIAAPIYVW